VYRPLPRFLLRAPLLPVSAVWRGPRALLRHPLGASAVQLASPSLARAAAGARRDRALERYARRAAFRATPHGLLAGVCMGTLADRTAIATGAPGAHLAPTWARIAALARALLDDPDLRARTRLRVAPSALCGVGVVRWLGPGAAATPDDLRAPTDVQAVRPDDPFDEVHEAELVDPLPAILAAAAQWTAWADVRVAASATDEPDDVDELLLTLVDDGLLHSDLSPPIVGAAAGAFMRARLDALGEGDAARALDQASAALAAGDIARGAAGLSALPGGDDDAGIHAVLVHLPRRPPTLERAAVERAARLVPLLVRLQDALAPPAAERFAQPALADALDAATELFGGGAFDVAALAAGDYGVELRGGDDDDPAPRAPDTAVLTLLLDAIADAARGRRAEATLDAASVEAALHDVAGPRLPCSAELFVAPVPRRPGKPPGTGWLLGLHAPAAASLGRFGHALGDAAIDAIAELDTAERRARPYETSVDVAFAPTPSLTDLAARPRTSRRTLALTRWGDADDSEVAPALLDLVADPDEPDALALRERVTGLPIVPASFSRLRSRTAPAGIARLLVGWSLWRQHAAWALPLGPLAELAFVPRLCLDGFVIAPASWRLPRDARTPAAIRRWRQAASVPRHVQVGEGDELLPVDLTAATAAADLGDHERVFEIWPPLDETVDREGRRLEAVVMLIEEPDATDAAVHAQRAAAIRSAGTVPPPARVVPVEDGWRTFKLFGAQSRQDDLLARLLPTIRAAQHAGEIDRWFFQRYIEGPGSRHHLRVRVHAPDGAAAHGFEDRLRERLGDARAGAIVTGVEIDEYRPELGRFRAEELDAVHGIFESDSELTCALLPAPADPLERISLLVRALDALATGLGLSVDARHAVAVARRRAAETSAALDDDDRARADAAFRRAGRGLRAALAADVEPGGAAADVDAKLAAHRARTAHAGRALPAGARTRLLPTLLHLSAVRHLGADRDGERLAYTFWERTLQGLRKPAGRTKSGGRSGGRSAAE